MLALRRKRLVRSYRDLEQLQARERLTVIQASLEPGSPRATLALFTAIAAGHDAGNRKADMRLRTHAMRA